MEKYVFRSIDDAPGYKVINENCPDGYFMNSTLFGDEPQQKCIGDRVVNPEPHPEFPLCASAPHCPWAAW